MTIRRTARWQTVIDERILEHLDDEPWSSATVMASLPAVHATAAQVRERCKLLADAELVALPFGDTDIVELTTWGQLYLEGEVDVALHRRPSRRVASV